MVAHGWTGVDDVFSASVISSTPSSRARRCGARRARARTGQGVRDAAGEHQTLAGRRSIQGVACLARADAYHRFVRRRSKRLRFVCRTELEIVNNRDMPDISVQHLLAVMLIDGGSRLLRARLRALRDRRVLELRRRIQAIGDPVSPIRSAAGGVIEVILKDGRRLTHRRWLRRMFENP